MTVDTPIPSLVETWLQGQSDLLKAQQSFWRRTMSSDGSIGQEPALDAVQTTMEEAQKTVADWIAAFSHRERFVDEGDNISLATLQRMMDPGQFVFAGTDEINQTIQKLVEGAEYSDIALLERQMLKATDEFIKLREASAAFRMVVAKGWGRAFIRFSGQLAEKPEKVPEGWRAVFDQWLEVANGELVALQRTDEFLKVQRNLLRAGVDYRLRESAIVERWCQARSLPTRSEIDELHLAVYQLRKQVRDLIKTTARLQNQAPSPAKAQG